MRSLFICFCLGVLSFSSSAFAAFGNTSFNTTNSPFASGNNNFVPVDQAFPFQVIQQNNTVYLDWQIKPGYYLYKDRLSFTSESNELGAISFPKGVSHKDEFFGEVTVYKKPLSIQVPLLNSIENGQLNIEYQGCASAGFCYPPETHTIKLAPFTPIKATEKKTNTSSNSVAPMATQLPTKQVNRQATPTSQDSTFADKLGQNWWTPFLFLALGIGLAFTPCVLPMYPILTSIVLGSGKLSARRALGLAFIYVQGMAVTYTALGLVVASAGMQFQAAMQHPYVLIGLSALFVVLSLSMFGLYSLQLPSSAQTWLNNLSNKQQGGNTLGVFAMGAISGLVCSPCTTAPLSGALLYVAQSGDLLTGAIALYALAMGMGIPLIIVAVFGNKLLPKAGMWMEHVKTLFGFVLLAAPIFLLARIIDPLWVSILWSGLGIVTFGWLYHVKNSFTFGSWKQSLIGIIAILGLVSSVLPLLSHYELTNSHTRVQDPESTVTFIKISSVQDLNQQLEIAKQNNQPVMLDFFAQWCVACKEFDKYTFHDPAVEKALSHVMLLQADVTKNTAQDIALLKHLRVLGLPTIEFWDKQGTPLPHARLTGFKPADEFLQHINQHIN